MIYTYHFDDFENIKPVQELVIKLRLEFTFLYYTYTH